MSDTLQRLGFTEEETAIINAAADRSTGPAPVPVPDVDGLGDARRIGERIADGFKIINGAD